MGIPLKLLPLSKGPHIHIHIPKLEQFHSFLKNHIWFELYFMCVNFEFNTWICNHICG